MVSSVNSINQYQLNYRDLEIIRRLQSLGVNPSGDKSFDTQRLQVAEIEKKRSTLATNSDVNLSRIEGTRYDFSSILGANANRANVNGFSGYNDLSVSNNVAQYSMVGANQIAELNKLKLGLIA